MKQFVFKVIEVVLPRLLPALIEIVLHNSTRGLLSPLNCFGVMKLGSDVINSIFFSLSCDPSSEKKKL